MNPNDCANCPAITGLRERVIVLETEQKTMKDDIGEIKETQKQNQRYIMSTLVTSLLGLVGIVATFLMG